MLRMIEQATAFIGQTIFQLKKQDKQEEIQIAIDELYKRYSLPNADLIRSLTPEAVVEMLSHSGGPNLDQIAIAAMLLHEEGELAADQHNDDVANQRFAKALHLWLVVDATRMEDEPRRRIQRILDMMHVKYAEDTTKQLLLQYYIDRGQYAEAENTLYWISLDPANEELARLGMEFYQALMTKSDEELEAGFLPRSEVRDGLRDWQKRFQLV